MMLGASLVNQDGDNVTGFHDMVTLEYSVTSTENTDLANQGGPDQVASDTCNSTGATTAVCNLTDTDGSSITLQVNISADDNTWVSS
jgi:hypothetical protein